jgi:hypothetical protein
MAYLSDPSFITPTVRGGEPYTGNQQFKDTGTLRSCMRCSKHRPMAGGRIDPRTRFWNCAGCVATWMPKP